MENVINRVRLLAFVDDGIIIVMKMMLMIAFRIPLSLQGSKATTNALLPVLANNVQQQEGRARGDGQMGKEGIGNHEEGGENEGHGGKTLALL